jgi:hypothetical protein
MKTCNGQFSADTVVLLRDARARDGESAIETFGTYACAVCGRTGLTVRNYGGKWIPAPHNPLPRKRANPSGKR